MKTTQNDNPNVHTYILSYRLLLKYYHNLNTDE